MEKTIKIFLLLSLTCFSFYYTDKVINMINKKDPLMIEITNVKTEYDILPVNAILDDDTIIPGIKGKEIDIDKSYENMRSGGIFREEALIFNDLYPSDNIANNKDKYIIRGNTTKYEVAIIVIFSTNYIEAIEKLNNITIFINHKDINTANINLLKNKEIYTYGNNGIYNSEILVSDNTIINRLSSNKSTYCLVKEKNETVKNLCSEKGMNTILPNIIGGYSEVKNSLSNGSIILLNNLNDIDTIIKYIESKGQKIVPLSKLLAE